MWVVLEILARFLDQLVACLTSWLGSCVDQNLLARFLDQLVACLTSWLGSCVDQNLLLTVAPGGFELPPGA